MKLVNIYVLDKETGNSFAHVNGIIKSVKSGPNLQDLRSMYTQPVQPS